MAGGEELAFCRWNWGGVYCPAGSGLRKAPSLFDRGAGTGGLGLAIEGPSEAKMSCKDNKDGSCSVEYIPFTPGDYDVNITFGGHPIPGRWERRAGGQA